MLAPPTLNDPAERKNRQLAYAQETEALTMRLIRATASRAEKALEKPEPAPEPEAPRARTPDHILEFVRLTRALNQTMINENRIANDDFTRRQPTYRPATDRAPTPDPRPPLLRQAFYQATEKSPDRARRRRDIDQAIDHHLAADPAQTIPAPDLLGTISADLDIDLDPARLSDELLGITPKPGRRQNL